MMPRVAVVSIFIDMNRMYIIEEDFEYSVFKFPINWVSCVAISLVLIMNKISK